MSATTNSRHAQVVYPPKGNAATYVLLTGVAALTAALAAFTSLTLGWAPWIMFLGWVAYFTRPTPSDGVQTFATVVIGLVLGAAATLAAGTLGPSLGALALPIVVFVIACVVIATRGLPILNNLLGYFIGLITFFAAHQEPAAATIATLAAAIAIGFAAGFASQRLQTAVAN